MSHESIPVSIAIPVYCGAQTLPVVMEEIRPLVQGAVTPAGRAFHVLEVVLAWDHGPDNSPEVMQELAAQYPWVKPVWLSRNFGQHPATVAAMAASRGQWVVTIDEDGQQNPADIGSMLDVAHDQAALLVYAAPTNKPPHSALRNMASKFTKGRLLPMLTGEKGVEFNSFRLIHGEHARNVAAYCGPGVYLDVALGWIISDVAPCPVALRAEGREATSYSMRRLMSHMWRLVLSSGNRPLRIMSGLGFSMAAVGLLYAVWVVISHFVGSVPVAGWSTLVVITLLVGGAMLASLGIVAEYVGMAASMSMGKPVYVVSSDALVTLRAGRVSGVKPAVAGPDMAESGPTVSGLTDSDLTSPGLTEPAASGPAEPQLGQGH